jgi:hypothetical protein
MGVASSSNTAKSVAKIANSVSANTSTSQSQISSVADTIILNNCLVEGDVNIKIMAEFVAKSQQIVEAMQNTNIQNSIAQQMQQEAQSTVGSLGIGVAEASNYVSTYSSMSTDVSSMVSTVSTQASFVNNTIICDGSTIKGDFNIDLSTSTNFWSDQAVHSEQITKISNTIDQSIQQKATAKVEGIGGVLILIAIMIALIGYSFGKTIGKSMSALGIGMAIIALFIMFFIIILMYVKETPPFFSKPQDCYISGGLSGSKCAYDKCIKRKIDTVALNKTPLKYMYNIIGGSSSDKDGVYGMLNMIIFSSINSTDFYYNQGFNALSCSNWGNPGDPPESLGKFWNLDTTFKEYGVPQLPNPLYIPTFTVDKKTGMYALIPASYIVNPSNSSDPSAPASSTPSVYPGVSELKKENYVSRDDFMKADTALRKNIVARLNSDAWREYFSTGDSKEQLKRALHARYVLTTANRFDNNIYIFDGTFPGYEGVLEEVSIHNKYYLSNSEEAKKNCYKFSKFQSPQGGDFSRGISVNSGGALTGYFGICDTKQNKLNEFMKKIGNYMVMFLFILIGIFCIFIFIKRKRGQSPTEIVGVSKTPV